MTEAAEDEAWALPATAHVPGVNPRPDPAEAYFAIAASAPDPTDPFKWRQNRAWLAGLRLYRRGCFWEAHEVWEAVWANASPNSAERLLTQSLIQLANACLKLRMQRPAAAARLAGIALSHLPKRGNGPVMGLDPDQVRHGMEAFAAALSKDGEAMAPEI